MFNLKITDETAPLKSVVVGTAKSSGPVPAPEAAKQGALPLHHVPMKVIGRLV